MDINIHTGLRLALLTLAGSFLAIPNTTAQDSPRSVEQVISASELQAAGITRLSNVLMLVDGARYSTIDGFTIAPSFSGLAPVQDRLWAVEIDDLPIETGVLDVQNLNGLAVPVASIDSIVVRTTPLLRMGRYRNGGLIQIYTKAPHEDSDYFARASLSAVNETGDPGPFRYVESSNQQNVDKEGPDGSIDVGYSSKGTVISAGGVVHQIIPTDPAVFARNYQSFDVARTPEIRVAAPFVSLASQVAGLLATVRLSGASFDDMMYSRDIGREVPVRYKRVGMTGSIQSRDEVRLRFRTEWDWSARLARNDGRATRLPMDWKERSARVASSVSTNLQNRRVELGGAISFLGARSSIGMESGRSILTPRIFGGVSAETAIIGYGVDGYLAIDQTGVGGGGVLRLETTPMAGHRARLSIAAAQTLPSESNPLAFWAHRGLVLTSETDFRQTVGERESRSLSTDLSWTWNPTERMRLELSSFGRRFSGLRYSDRIIEPDGVSFRVISRDYQNAWGSTIGVTGFVSQRSTFGEYSLLFNYQTVMSGNQLFYEAYDTIPRRQVRLEAVHRVGDRFSLKNSLFHYSSSYWDEFGAIESETDYSATVAGFVRWDIAISKRLAQNRLHVSAAIENVLNERVGFHPIGATFDRALRVQMSLAFD